jgi:hypothetical protein
MHNYLFLKDNFRRTALTMLLLGAAAGFHVARAAEGLFPAATVMAPPAQPMTMPEFDFANLHGGALKSSDMKGKVIVIRFWATW